MEKTASDILLAAAALLEEEDVWSRGSYFRKTNKGCSMCAHGAIAYCGNDIVKNYVLNKHITDASETTAHVAGNI